MFSSSLLKVHSLLILPALFSLMFLARAMNPDNHPPVAVSDSYTIHGCALPLNPALTANDFDPDGDPITITGFPQVPAHGTLSRGAGNAVSYCPAYAYIGSDSFTYTLCDNHSACTTGSVTLNVVNQPPNGGADFYNVHGTTTVGPFLANDSDPDGDPVSVGDVGHERIVAFPQHGSISPSNAGSNFELYTPNPGYTGPDSFTYNACDGLGLCTETAVNLSVNDTPPVATPDAYLVHAPGTIVGPFMINDYDPDGDSIAMGGPSQESIVTLPQHGHLTGIVQPDKKSYAPDPGFVGTDSFVYAICDSLQVCSTATVTLYVVGGGENDGVCDCTGGCVAVGKPVNVTSGNMYVRQSDYSLPAVGPAINIMRSFNSNSQTTGLLGKGWSTQYDESITAYDNNLARFNQPDGRAIYLGRQIGSSGAFAPLEGDFHGSLVQNGGNGFTLTMKDGSAHQFNAAGKLTSLTDRVGNQTTLAYDTGGKLTSVTDPFGRVLTVTTNTNGRALSISDSMGAIATYTYGGSNELLTVTYADNSGFQFSYDGSFRITSVTDALGNIVESHTYDSQGRALTSEKQGGVEHYSLSYVSDTETDVTDALSHVTKYTFDTSKGRNVVTRVEGLCSCGGVGSQTQTWTYDNQLNLTSKTDALNHTTSYTYDGNGNRLTETDAVGTVTYTYNGFAEVLARTDQLNGATTNSYDTVGDLLTATDALNNTTTFTYNARGQVLTATDARGKVTTFTYDTSGNTTRRTDANSIITFFFYDARSRLTKVRDGLSRSTLYAYDAAGRVNKITHPDL
ncbi:MAG TPA: Ig-like domain-containing protein, partial [Pyrinomonadaceae bacterium]|nr:Ig-like domain-containing protein [Pyrinomonadaceae bacterium]